MAREAKVFFYGLFMDPEALKARGFQPSNVKAAFVDGFALRLGQRATLVAAPDRRVYGMLMTLPHHEIDALYSESSVELYRPEPVLAHSSDGSSEPALCFNLPTIAQSVDPNPEYAAALQSVARRLGLPEGYVSAIGDEAEPG
jgi:AIG2-like family